MAIATERVPYSVTSLIIREDAAGTSDAAIADALNRAGAVVPRQTGVDHRQYRYPSGHALATHPGEPGVWNAATVAEVIASTEVAAVIAGTANHATLAPNAALTIT